MVKRILLLSLFLVATTLALKAQNVVTGTVVDRDGNPIPGAKVEIVGSTESTITELDGTFSIATKSPAEKVRVLYGGMQTKVKKVKPDMVIKLRETTWWNRKPEKYDWLISVQGAFPESGVKNPSLGLMLGRVKNIGWYVKGVYSPGKSTEGDYVAYPDDSDMISYWTTGKDKRSFYAATAGVLVRLQSPIHAYVGAGYASRKVAWELADGTYFKNTEYSYNGFALDYGLMLRVGMVTLNGGVLMSLADGCNFVGNFGIGVTF